MPALSSKLKNRELWFDGTSSVSATDIEQLLSEGKTPQSLFVDHITPEIVKYNRFVGVQDRLDVKGDVNLPQMEWCIPEQYKHLDIEKYLTHKLIDHIKVDKLSQDDIDVRVDRIGHELALYAHYNCFDLLRALIYVINTLLAQNIVWGVGRGSSVSSYILYLIGVHDVDSVKYDLDVTDFLRPQ